MRRRFGSDYHVIFIGGRRRRKCVREGRGGGARSSDDVIVVNAAASASRETWGGHVVVDRGVIDDAIAVAAVAAVVVRGFDGDDDVAKGLFASVIVEMMTVPKDVSESDRESCWKGDVEWQACKAFAGIRSRKLKRLIKESKS